MVMVLRCGRQYDTMIQDRTMVMVPRFGRQYDPGPYNGNGTTMSKFFSTGNVHVTCDSQLEIY